MTTDVIVAGAGPVGLLLATELRLGGARVMVLETRLAPTTESRASTVHARTMEALDCRGLIPRFGSLRNDPRGHFAGIPLDLTLPGPYPGQWKVLQTRTEEILQERALDLGADLRRGHTVTAMDRDGDGVVVTASGAGRVLRVGAPWLVGCDGEDSTVRRLIGADFPGQEMRRRMLRADVVGIRIRDRRFERCKHGLAVAARRPDGVTRVMVHEFGEVPPGDGVPLGLADFPVLAKAWERVTGEDIADGVPLWVNAFGDASRQLSAYRHGRVLFAGDAAHQQMPVGGQALNLGLQDAFNLGWKLALRVREPSAEGLLNSYDVERRAVGTAVLTNVRAQADLLLGGPEVEALRQVLAEVIGVEAGRRHLAAAISGVGVRYDVPGANERDRLLGRFLPDLRIDLAGGPPGRSVRSLLHDGRGVLLVLMPGSEAAADVIRQEVDGQAARAVSGWAGRIRVVIGRRASPRAAEGPDVVHGSQAPAALLVRPDGHVVWVTHGEAGLFCGVTEALTCWFGDPQEFG